MQAKTGIVYIVGAGPGDIGLITVKGMNCLQKAEVVVYDYHLNAQILNYVKQEAEFIYAGKRGGRHTMTQDEINSVLVSKAKEGKVICRLKGGDPFVFGRGGEEAELLVRNGINFEIVPGVSSAVAAPAYAGIPLTHRLYSSSFAVIPGYEDTTKEESAIDWTKLSTGVGTLVVLMAVKNLDTLVQKLVENGRSPETPVAVVRWGTRPDQKTIVSTLGNIVSEVKEREIMPPAVVVVGEVVRLRETLRWYEDKVLFGHRVLVTREHAIGFEPLEELGAEIIEFPTIEIAPPAGYDGIDRAIANIHTYDWLIFTSANGFRYFINRFLVRDCDIRDLKGLRICAIGAKTAAEIKKYGMKVELIPEEFNAEGLVEAFSKEARGKGQEESGVGSQESGVKNSELPTPDSQLLKGLRLLLPGAEKARELFPEKARELGAEIDTPVVYRTVKPVAHGKRLKRYLREGRITIATFTSAATFNNFIEIMGDEAHAYLKGVCIAVIGPVTAKAVERAGFNVGIMPEEATIEAMVQEIIRMFSRKENS